MLNFTINADNFRKNYFEKAIYLQRNAYDSDSFNLVSLNNILDILTPKSPQLKMYLNGLVSEEEYTKAAHDIGFRRTVIEKDAFYHLLRSGASMVLNRVDLLSPEVQILCAKIFQFVGYPVVANGYFAVSGRGTFGNHWDTHDVFVVQMIGRKRWKVFPSTFSLPVSSQTSRNHKAECPTDSVFDGYLEAGDVLYIPRGFWHNATPDEGETFHVAIGVHSYKMWDYLKWTLSEVLPQYAESRQSINMSPSGVPQGFENQLIELGAAANEAISNKENFINYCSGCVKTQNIHQAFDLGFHTLETRVAELT